MADAAARVGIGDLDELADGVRPSRDVRGDALGDGLHLAADDEAVVAAGHEGLDDDVAAARLALGGLEARADVLLALQVEADTAAVVAVEGLTTTG